MPAFRFVVTKQSCWCKKYTIWYTFQYSSDWIFCFSIALRNRHPPRKSVSLSVIYCFYLQNFRTQITHQHTLTLTHGQSARRISARIDADFLTHVSIVAQTNRKHAAMKNSREREIDIKWPKGEEGNKKKKLTWTTKRLMCCRWRITIVRSISFSLC